MTNTHLLKIASISILFFSCFFLAPKLSFGQAFVDINAGITGVLSGTAKWGDFDNDHDLDLIISGETLSGSIISKIYQNDSGIFSFSDKNLSGMKKGSLAWGDYDNDGDLDLLVCGNTEIQQTLVYKNNEGEFTALESGIDYLSDYSTGCWADYDNDGDLDIFITGNWNSKLYRNDGQDFFTETENEFAMLSASRSSWSDYDADGDLDLLLTGDTGGGMELYLYINHSGYFEEKPLPNMGLSSGSIEWGDYDNDGDQDILIMGFNDNVEPYATIYQNNGNHVFSDTYAGLPPVALGNASWGDFDNDGDLDVAITGKLAGCGVFASSIYENMGNNFFNDINTGLTTAERSYISWGDFDNDTDLDLVLCGSSYSGGSFTKIYRNDISLPNILPEAPQNLSTVFENQNVVLTWDKANDAQTPQDALTYNIRIGTSPADINSLSPMSDVVDGYRRIPSPGNTTQTNFWRIAGLEEGQMYYWSVQTIDNAYGTSEFSEEHSFYVTFTGETEVSASIGTIEMYPNPAKNKLHFNFDESNEVGYSVLILSMDGRTVKKTEIKKNQTIDVSDLTRGVYIVETINGTAQTTEKSIVE
ncbi:MAG: FG-GAP-like repeat-containing protein [Bacteroidales bacterium]